MLSRACCLCSSRCSFSSGVGIAFFFFKQKTAYEIMPSLVGSEMCIRDSPHRGLIRAGQGRLRPGWRGSCLLYTSDAADDLLCVDLGGRRIIKKKKNQ